MEVGEKGNFDGIGRRKLFFKNEGEREGFFFGDGLVASIKGDGGDFFSGRLKIDGVDGGGEESNIFCAGDPLILDFILSDNIERVEGKRE